MGSNAIPVLFFFHFSGHLLAGGARTAFAGHLVSIPLERAHGRAGVPYDFGFELPEASAAKAGMANANTINDSLTSTEVPTGKARDFADEQRPFPASKSDFWRSLRHHGPLARSRSLRPHLSQTAGHGATRPDFDPIRGGNRALRAALVGDHAPSRPSPPHSSGEPIEASRLAPGGRRETSQPAASAERPTVLARREL